MIPTVTNTPIATTLFIIFLCIVGMYLTVQLDKAKKEINKLTIDLRCSNDSVASKHLQFLAKKTELAISKRDYQFVTSIHKLELIDAAEYGYNFHKATRYKLWAFNKNCLENFLQHLEAKQLKNES